MENLERINSVNYELYCKPFGSITINEPKGWEGDTRSLERDKDSKAITNKTEVDLEFYGEAADFLSTVFNAFGIHERVLLTKREKSLTHLDERWLLRYVQALDMSTFKQDARTGKVTVNATEGGLFDDIKNRESDDYNILNNESADGENIGELTTHPFQPVSRGIFIESYLKDTQSNYAILNTAYRSSDAYNIRTIPLKEVYISDKKDIYEPMQALEAYNNIDSALTSETPGDVDPAESHFFKRAEQDKQIRVRMRLKFNISDIYERNIVGGSLSVAFRRGELVGDEDRLKEHENLTSLEGVMYIDESDRNTYTYEFDREIEVRKGESLSFVFSQIYFNALDGGIGQTATAKLITYLNVTESWVKVEDKTQYDITVSRCLKPIDLFNRLVAKITGKTNLVRSTIFGEGGEYENFVVDNGFWARGFPDVLINEEGEEETIQFKTSFKDAFESFCYLEPLCWFVDIEGDKQVVRIEKATYTMQNFIGVKLDAVDDVEYESSKNDWFSGIELGHEGSLEYEEINGLDEPNGKSFFPTHLKEAKGRYTVLSKYRFDSVGYELIRRMSFANYPKEDTPRDKDIWIHDAKKVGNFYTHRLYNDVGMSLPKGIFAPDTAWNLTLSPMNRLFYGHGYSVKRCLYHYPDKSIRFGSSNANENLVTSIDGFELKEKGQIKIRDIEKPRIEAAQTTVSFRMNQTLENQFLGMTKVNGINVPNYFGLIEYKVNGEKRYGRIVKLDGNEKSKLTMINAKL